MADPLTTHCAYCNSTAVLDDAWWCHRSECWDAMEQEGREWMAYEARTPLTRSHARGDIAYNHAHLFWQHGLARLREAEDKWAEGFL